MLKPYDRLFKELAEEDLPAFLWLFAGLKPVPGEEVKPLPRELHLPVWVLDHSYEMRRNGETSVCVLEAKARWESGAVRQLAKYGVAVALHYDFETPVIPVLVLFSPNPSPRSPEERFSRQIGHIGIHVQLRIVRLWEVDAAAVLEANMPSLLPWVPLLNSGLEEVAQAAERIAITGDRRLASAFCTLGGLRYDRLTLEKLLEKMYMFIPPELFDEGPAYIETRQKALAEGQAEGKAEGRVESARELLRHLLRSRFPDLVAEAAALDNVRDPERLVATFDEILAAQNAEQVRRALKSH
ncbi:MAG: hypothetical protein ABIZ80_15250 [Bryobacteraceae bacterium]